MYCPEIGAEANGRCGLRRCRSSDFFPRYMVCLIPKIHPLYSAAAFSKPFPHTSVQWVLLLHAISSLTSSLNNHACIPLLAISRGMWCGPRHLSAAYPYRVLQREREHVADTTNPPGASRFPIQESRFSSIWKKFPPSKPHNSHPKRTINVGLSHNPRPNTT